MPGRLSLCAVERLKFRREALERTFRNIPPALELLELVPFAGNRIDQRLSSLLRVGRRHRVPSGKQRVGETLRHVGC